MTDFSYEPDDLVELACQAIYRQFEGYWPNESERARIGAAVRAVTDPSAAVRAALWHQVAESLAAALVAVAGHLPLFVEAPKTHDERRKAARVEAHYQLYRAAMTALEQARRTESPPEES